MRYLLDVNILVAWGWSDHQEHVPVAQWIAQNKKDNQSLLLTSAIPQLGFVRVSVQRAAGQIKVDEACSTLSAMLNTLGEKHRFIPDDLAAIHFPRWCQSSSSATDAHLLQLAQKHQATLATLDTTIPGAVVIPKSNT